MSKKKHILKYLLKIAAFKEYIFVLINLYKIDIKKLTFLYILNLTFNLESLLNTIDLSLIALDG